MLDEGRTKGRDPAVTSRMMARVKNKDSKAELAIRRRLHAMGFRYRLHYKKIAGKPDIVFPARRIAVFVDGDFWHGNAWRLRGLGSLAELFPTRTAWWVTKITKTMERDSEVTRLLADQGWTVLRFWESEVLADPNGVAEQIASALREEPASNDS